MKALENKPGICPRVATRIVLIFGTAIAAGTGTPTRAAIPDANGIIHACYAESGATTRIIDSTMSTCRSNETAIQWNQAGSTGVAGPRGPAAAVGSRGPSNAFVGGNFSAGFASVHITGNASAPTRVAALALPAGSFVLNAAVGLYVNVAGGTLVPFSNVRCAFSAGMGTIGTQFRASVGGSTSSYATLPLAAAVTLANADTVVLTCVADSGPPVFTQPSVVTAVQVETLVTP